MARTVFSTFSATMGDGQRARVLNLNDVDRAAVASYAMGDGQRARDLNLFDVGRAAKTFYAPPSHSYKAQ